MHVSLIMQHSTSSLSPRYYKQHFFSMGPQISRSYFMERIEECRALSGVLKVIYRDSDIKLIVATVAGSPMSVLTDYFAGKVKFAVSYRRCSGYTVASPLASEEITRKLLTYEQYEFLKKLLYSLRNCLAAGSSPVKPISAAEECAICLDAGVEVVLPCSHSFCSKCAQEWSDSNPTCPCCRQDLIQNAGEEWQLEDWNESDMKAQFLQITQDVIIFLEELPILPPNISETHKILEIEGDEWELAVPQDDDDNPVELDESKEKPSKFMGL